MSIIKIALTGGIASGKTQVSELLAKKGMTIIDMDVVARTVVAPNMPAYKALISAFGSRIVAKNGELDRSLLRTMMFQDKAIKKRIENIVQPPIMASVEQQLSRLTVAEVIIVVPLLLEKKIAHLYDKILVIDCDEQTQIKRLIKRDNISDIAAKRILKQQVSRHQRLDFVNNNNNAYLLDNSGDKAQLLTQINDLPFIK